MLLLYIIWWIILFSFLFYRFYFLRKPNRYTPQQDNIIVSPASWKVISIISSEDEYINIYKHNRKALQAFIKDLNGPVTIVSIMLTVFDVHYQRACTDGIVIWQDYNKWAFHNAVYNASNLKSTFENENNQIVIRTEQWIQYKIIQIAWYVARRIVSYVQPGDQIKKWDIIWLIKMGSQVSIIFDKSIDITIQQWQKVIDWETIIWFIKK